MATVDQNLRATKSKHFLFVPAPRPFYGSPNVTVQSLLKRIFLHQRPCQRVNVFPAFCRPFPASRETAITQHSPADFHQERFPPLRFRKIQSSITTKSRSGRLSNMPCYPMTGVGSLELIPTIWNWHFFYGGFCMVNGSTYYKKAARLHMFLFEKKIKKPTCQLQSIQVFHLRSRHNKL